MTEEIKDEEESLGDLIENDIVEVDNGCYVLHLTKPLKPKVGDDIESLRFPEEATVVHLEAMDKAKTDESIRKQEFLLAALVDVPRSTLRKMRAVDFYRAVQVSNEVLGLGNVLKTGGQS